MYTYIYIIHSFNVYLNIYWILGTGTEKIAVNK